MSNEADTNVQMANVENIKNSRAEGTDRTSEGNKSTVTDTTMEGTDEFETFSRNNPAYNMIEVRPDAAYINNQFERFINVDNPFRMMKITLSDRVLVPRPSSTLTSPLEFNFFEKSSAVFYDAVSSCSKFDYFFYMNTGGIIHRLIFNRKEAFVCDYNAVANPYPFEFNPNDLPDDVPRLPISLRFAGEDFAFMSTGTGWLIIYHTDDRKSPNRWTSVAYMFLPNHCDSFVLHQDTNTLQELDYGQPFHVSEVQMSGQKIFDVVITAVVELSPEERAKTKTQTHRTTMHWMKIVIGDMHVARFAHHRIIDVHGRVEGLTLGADHKLLVVASNQLPVVVFDSQSQIKDKGVRNICTRIPIEPVYTWNDDENTVTITFNRCGIICKDDLTVDYSANSINVIHRWERWLCGNLAGEILPDQCSWTFDRSLEKPPQTTVVITLKKKNPGRWSTVVPTNVNGRKIGEISTVPKNVPSETKKPGKLYLSWIDSDVAACGAELSNAEFILAGDAAPNAPKKFLMGFGDNCIVFNFESRELFKHEYTFEGFIPMKSAKLNQKYTVFNHKDRSVAIVDKVDAAYVYYRRIPNNPIYQMEVLNAANPHNVGVQRILEFGRMDSGPEAIAAISTEKLLYIFCYDRFYVIAV